MCGITGAIWSNPSASISADILRAMTDSISHRGPDAEGFYRSDFRERPAYEAIPGVALGHRRLSIIDLEAGQQPMSNEDDTVWVVFNGEIYNYPALRQRLEGAGHRFRTNCDTEAIVHLYEDEGPDCFKHLNGMFAIAIWDARRNRLVLGRDRVGQKPLVYRHEADRLLFGSELKSILKVPNVPREIDSHAVDEYLTYQYVPHPNCILKGFRKLPPGHRAVWERNELKVDAYWQPDCRSERVISADDAADELRDLLRSAVSMRMRSDVPLGAFLSGGVDSSLIVALMQETASDPVKTFSIGFPIADYDESNYAKQVAEHLGTEHHAFEVTPDAVDVLPKLIWHFDEPMADSSAIPTWYVSRLTREHVTVALTGDGGDELFAGYRRYRAAGLASRIDRISPLRALLAAKFWQRVPSSSRQASKFRQFKRFSEALRQSPVRRYLNWISIFNEERRGDLYPDEFVDQIGGSDPIEFLSAAWDRGRNRHPVNAISLADLQTYLPCDLMTKVDITSMAHGLECRQPILDYRVVEFAASLPAKLKVRGTQGKWLLQHAFGELLPENIWKRRKMGFGVPLDHWLRNELHDLAHDTLLDSRTASRGYARPEAIQRLLDEHQSETFDHSYRVWALLVLELWCREWID